MKGEAASYRISEAAEAAGVNVQTLRYYERRGILDSPARTSSGYRQYGQGAVDRVRFIKRAQDLGFTLEEIGELLDLRVEHAAACEAVEERARRKLEDVERKRKQLERMREALAGLIEACERRRPTEECPILEALERE